MMKAEYSMQALKAGIIAFLMGFSPAVAQDAPAAPPVGQPPVVVELYTSQGCSSCPPADALLQQLAGRPEVIALALHVDYWDYIGWEDSFARPEFTQRQRRYARAAGASAIYTPQFVVSGQQHVIGARPMELMDGIRAAAAAMEPMGLTIERQGDGVRIRASALPQPRPLVVQLVRYMPRETVDVLRGENAGLALSYANIVTDWTAVAEWDGAAPLDIEVEAPGDAPLVVLVQDAGQGRICAAARLLPG
ncbi:DUF1223 domain-containing protein [Pseudoroseicyclus sp. CXY001]|uniref:DUF1223 domain-containing protein n=1 Tax=Pseudoroseicyclus sp. CXY001 TaxID=3242492 RepID=UPI00358DA8C3